MEKHGKTYNNAKKADEAPPSNIKARLTTTTPPDQFKQERDIEEVLSPFWAWRALSH